MSNTETIYGINAVENRLKLEASKPQQLIVRGGKQSARVLKILEIAEAMSCPVQRVGDAWFDDATDINHQGVALVIESQVLATEDDLYDIAEQHKGSLLILVLDGVTDPRNLGACIRSAATLGVHAVVAPKDKSASLNEAAVKTASGAASYVPFIQVTNLARTLGKLQQAGVWVVGTLLETNEHICDIDLKGDIALVMGSEEKGLRHNTVKHCDYLVKIPMNNENFGFNVSVAAGISLYEVARQRLS